MQKSDYLFVIKSYILWRILIFTPIFLAPFFFSLQKNFLGGGLSNYLSNPYLWSWANFDGEHYLSIANLGYGNGEQAFFPVYSLLIKFFGRGILSGILISNICFLLALIGLYKLIKLDFSEKVSRLTVISLLVFPGSFFFASVYTESIFLALTVWSFYFYRKEKFFWAGVFGMFSSATRVVGIVLLPVYFFDLLLHKKLKIANWLLLIPAGMAGYMYYSYIKWGDVLKFFHSASGFGEQRSDHLILLPQVFYRYFVKIIPNLNFSYFPAVFTTFTEIVIAILFIIFLFLSFRRLDKSYWLYSLLIYLIPTLSGSFSSLPRYILVAFPFFIYIAQVIQKRNFLTKIFIFIFFVLLSCIMQMLFVRGYFVS